MGVTERANGKVAENKGPVLNKSIMEQIQ